MTLKQNLVKNGLIEFEKRKKKRYTFKEIEEEIKQFIKEKEMSMLSEKDFNELCMVVFKNMNE